MKRAVVLIRASSTKQVVDGDSWEQQQDQCIYYLQQEKWLAVRTFEMVESGAKGERKFFQEVLDFCTDPQNNIDYVVFRNISRFTREGGAEYIQWKRKLVEHGVEPRDIYGTMQGSINTLANLGHSFSWSNYYPSETAEIAAAEQAKTDRRIILTQMIGAEIKFTNMGYITKAPTYGFLNKRVETEHGKRNILVENPDESRFVKMMFQMRAEGHTVKEIADAVNAAGYISRVRARRDPRTMKRVGQLGGKPMTPNHVDEIIQRTIYAGVICEKWTHYQPVKTKFPTFISVDLFNAANKGKKKIIVNGDLVEIRYGKDLKEEYTKQRRTRNNPLYPFRHVVLCPVCRHSLKGSSSTGGDQVTKYPAYHCSRGHKLWRVPRKDFHDTITDFVSNVKFEPGFGKLYEATFYEEFDKKMTDVIQTSKQSNVYVGQLLAEQEDVYQNIKKTPEGALKERLKKDFDDLEVKIKAARKGRSESEQNEFDVKIAFKQGLYLVEHLEELLIDQDNQLRQDQLFGVLFEEFPTYDEIVSRTVKLSRFFAINSKAKLAEIQHCDLDGNRTRDLFRDREAC